MHNLTKGMVYQTLVKSQIDLDQIQNFIRPFNERHQFSMKKTGFLQNSNFEILAYFRTFRNLRVE